jgi:peroxiredoxin
MKRKSLAIGMVLGLSLVAATAAALDAGARAPEINLPDTNGHTVNLAGLRGQVFIVDFWASWCAPCADEMPVLERLYSSHHAEGFTIVGVSQDENDAAMQGFLRQHHVSFPVARDSGHSVAGRYNPTNMPTTFIVDRHGIVRFVHRGFHARDASTIEHEVQTLLAEH